MLVGFDFMPPPIMQYADDHDQSISKDSVFDWGDPVWGESSQNADKGQDESLTGASNSMASGKQTRPPRYDPNSAIADVVDDILEDGNSETSDSDEEIATNGRRLTMELSESDPENGRRINGHHKKFKYGPGGLGGRSLIVRQTVIIFSIVGIIVAASVAIGFAVIGGDPGKKPSVEEGIPDQVLLETAERVVTACSENILDVDRSVCQQLCYSKLCCFQSGDYSCEEDVSKDCAVYAGCEALVEGIPVEAPDEDEE
mmetsp:Transcript_6623/g.10835  ORF Transcript_6623/g.10835 Transcript_6623/m.10835 type:complete len:257 (-) Transcript_6623:30-800(-)